MHLYEVRPYKEKRGFDLISDVLPFGRLCYGKPNAISRAIGYAEHYSRSHDAVIRVYDDAGNAIAVPSSQRGQYRGLPTMFRELLRSTLYSSRRPALEAKPHGSRVSKH